MCFRLSSFFFVKKKDDSSRVLKTKNGPGLVGFAVGFLFLVN